MTDGWEDSHVDCHMLSEPIEEKGSCRPVNVLSRSRSRDSVYITP